MFKDKELRKALADAGIIYENTLDTKYEFDSIMKLVPYQLATKSDLDFLREQNKQLKERLETLMELLGVTYEEAREEPAKLKKGDREVSLGPKRSRA